jgi:hypothetical protein
VQLGACAASPNPDTGGCTPVHRVQLLLLLGAGAHNVFKWKMVGTKKMSGQNPDGPPRGIEDLFGDASTIKDVDRAFKAVRSARARRAPACWACAVAHPARDGTSGCPARKPLCPHDRERVSTLLLPRADRTTPAPHLRTPAVGDGPD